MASFDFKTKPIPEMFLGVDDITPEYECTPSGNRLRGIWVYIGGTAHYFGCNQYTICNPVEATEDGRRQVVALAKELTDMKIADKDKLFGYHTVTEIITQFSYDEVAKKLDDWKKEKETIRVRDEVVNMGNSRKMVVTVAPKMSSNCVEYTSGIGKDGKVYEDVVASAYKKTGLHVDDLDSYLEI